jgi:hypothetical protein
VCRRRLRLDRSAVVRGLGILRSVETGTHPSQGVFVGADVHYLTSGGARAAAAAAAWAVFSCLAADRIALVPDAEPYQTGRFYRISSRQ